jgi:hypothetical protein
MVILACAARQSQGDTEDEWQPGQEKLDVFAYAGDSQVITDKPPIEHQNGDDSLFYFLDTQPDTTYPPEVHRVLLFASQYYGEAQIERDIAADVFDEQIQITFSVPYYRVEAGNFATQLEAERLLQRAQALGYRQSWVVSEPVDSTFWIELTADSEQADSLSQLADTLPKPPKDRSGNDAD